MGSYLDNLFGISALLDSSGTGLPFTDTALLGAGLRQSVDSSAGVTYLDSKGYQSNPVDFCYVSGAASGWSVDNTGTITNFNAFGWLPDGFLVSPGQTVLVIPHSSEPALLSIYTITDLGGSVYRLVRRPVWPSRDPLNSAAGFWPYGETVQVKRGAKYGGRGIQFDDTTPNVTSGWSQVAGVAEAAGSRIALAPLIFTATTTNATPTTIATFAAPVTESAYRGQLTVVGKSGANRYFKNCKFYYWYSAGVLTELGTHQLDSVPGIQLFIVRDDAAYTSDYGSSGTNFTVSVTGKAATTINWRAALYLSTEAIP